MAVGDRIYLYVLIPDESEEKRPVLPPQIYIYGQTSDTDRFQDVMVPAHEHERRSTQRWISPGISGQRYHDRPHNRRSGSLVSFRTAAWVSQRTMCRWC